MQQDQLNHLITLIIILENLLRKQIDKKYLPSIQILINYLNKDMSFLLLVIMKILIGYSFKSVKVRVLLESK
ncbi:hypothetical protein BpHYR1_026576 [Brachionus plicatilis]|uniref:Uncharacterized protein n=1 Tax=Brachionus plicatilis TaxID=10195 RepID=A0A3M7RYI6_BRAPC|nr:hypothetical protein BpHYR1_026576 [Brachionus plicatilis]